MKTPEKHARAAIYNQAMPVSEAARPSLLMRFFRMMRPSHEHSVTSASFLLMLTAAIGSFLSLIREAYIAWAYGAGSYTDAFVAAFTFPDLANYLFGGGAVIAAFVSILARYYTEERYDLLGEAISVVTTVVTMVMIVILVIAYFCTPAFIRFWFPQFGPQEAALCVHMTRILLPVQIFIVVGGVFRGVVSWRRTYFLPSLQPVIMSLFVVMAAVLFSRRFGIVSLAWGTLLGGLVGALLVNYAGIRDMGLRLRPLFDLRHPVFREWLMLSLPLMLGASLIFVDDPFSRHFAAAISGDITRLSYAKRIFFTLFNISAQASGGALIPIFADLYARKRIPEFRQIVGESFYRGSVFSLLMSGALFATALPLVDLIFRSLHGHFTLEDSVKTALLLRCFTVALVFWTAQVVYVRVYLAIGDTLTPTLVSTGVAAVSYPIYAGMFRLFGVAGLPLASNAGMIVTCVGFAILLRRKDVIPWRAVPWRDLIPDSVAVLLAALLATWVSHWLMPDGTRMRTLISLALSFMTWAVVSLLGLHWTRSRFLAELVRRVRSS